MLYFLIAAAIGLALLTNTALNDAYSFRCMSGRVPLGSWATIVVTGTATCLIGAAMVL